MPSPYQPLKVMALDWPTLLVLVELCTITIIIRGWPLPESPDINCRQRTHFITTESVSVETPTTCMVASSIYHSDLPNYKEAETETVFSQSTIQTENGSHFAFDDRTPPSHPPSPATITEYFERDLQRVPPLTPTSKYSIEDERESKGSLHIQEHQV